MCRLLDPLALALVALVVVAVALPAVTLVLVPALLGGLAQALAPLPLVGVVFRGVARALEALVAWLAEADRGPGSGLLRAPRSRCASARRSST